MSLKERIPDWLKLWHLILLIILAMAAIIGYLIQQKRLRDRCQVYLSTADAELARDNFDKTLEYLNLARAYCDGKEVEVREVTARTFKVAADYDQVRLVKDSSVLTTIDHNLLFLGKDLGENVAQVLVLKGIFEELSDRPGKSLEKYDLAAKQDYASAYNSYGYTVFKWKLGGSAWSDTALQKFQKAADLKPDYGWPYVNMAAVYLQLADKAMSEAKPNLDDARKQMPNAKANLQKAEKLLPDSPRVDLLWGHYHMLQALIFSARGLTPEANQSFYEARDKLIDAKTKNASIADTRVLLGSVYLQLRMFDEAVYELRNAVSLDDMNVVACARLVQALSLLPKANEQTSAERDTQVKRGLALIDNIRTRFTARSYETKDTEAREWLATVVKDYDSIEKDLKELEQIKPLNHANSKRKTR